MKHEPNEARWLAAAEHARVLTPITDLNVFRRDRSTNNWLVVLFVACLSVFSALLAVKISPLIAYAAGSGF